ncbi:MAG: VCBS repeat-containing protein [Flavobacteriales bacterium]|nr:VCBS repeat-containing protein [Flavobacteriales bacterium]
MNDGKGRLADATPQLAPTAMGPGMVTDARFADIDGASRPGPCAERRMDADHRVREQRWPLENITAQCGLANTAGWWNTVTAADLDGDGDVDLVGATSDGTASSRRMRNIPACIGRYGWNGRSDIVLGKEKEGKQLPVRGRECSSQQCPVHHGALPHLRGFRQSGPQRISTPERLEKALHLTATHTRSAVFLNDGSGGFTTHDLPVQAQLAPIQGIVPMDVNADGRLDLVVAGNHWGAEVETVRYDAGTGLVLLGDGKGSFAPTTIARSGFFAWGNVKDLALVRTGPDRVPTVIVANNNDRPQAFRLGRGLSALSAR